MSDLILINVTGRSVNAKYLPAQDPTAGWTGELSAQFAFDASWAGASKTAVFTAGEVSVPVQLADMTVEVPPEVLAVEGETLMVGVVGVWDDTTTRPTEVVPVVDITHGAYIPTEWRPTTPELYTQLLAAVAGHVRMVDGITPDQSGNVDLPPFPFLCSIGGTTCKNIYDAYGRGELVYGVDNNGGIYPLIQRPSLTSATFGGYNPVSRRATYWAAQIEDNETVWITGSESWERSYVLNNSSKLATCKAVYDELTKYYDKTFIDNAIAAAKEEAAQALATHNADALAHPAIRQTITELANRLNALADSDDATLDQLSEIVAYIKSNKSLIDAVTTSKVSVSDIVNSLTSTATNKPLSAAQGAVLKAAVDALEAEVEASKVLVLDADNLPDNAYNVVAAAFPSNRLCAMHVSIANVKYLFLQDAVYGEDYFTFSAVGRNGKLIKRRLYRDNTLSPSEVSDLSNVFIGDDNTTYSEWKTHIDAGQSCVWRSSENLGFDYAYIGMLASGTLLFSAIEYTLALTLEISPSGTKSLISYSIPSKPAPSEAGYVWTANSSGGANWAAPTGGSGGDYQPADFVVTVDGAGIADKTWAEVSEARQEGRRIYLDRMGLRYEYSYEGYDFSEFLHFNGEVVFSAKLYDWHQTVEFASEAVGGSVAPTVITINSAEGLSCDKTYAEIAAAVEAYATNGTPFLFYTPNGSTDDFAIGDNGEILVKGIKSEFGAHITYVLKADDTVTYTAEFMPLTVRYTYNPSGSKWSCDTTYEEIVTSISLGRQIVAYFDEALATSTSFENGVGIKHNVLIADADPGEFNSQIGIQTFVHFADETVSVGMTAGSLLHSNDSLQDYPLVMAQEDDIAAPEWMTGKELLSKLGIPTPTDSDNGKALVAQDGAAVWKEIAGGGDEWELLEDITLEEEVSEIIISDYELKKLYITAEIKGTATNESSTNGKVIVNNQTYWYSNVFVLTDGLTRWGYTFVEVLGDSKRHLSTTNNNNSYQSTTIATGYFDDGSNITSVKIDAAKGLKRAMGIGSHIKIYGVRA